MPKDIESSNADRLEFLYLNMVGHTVCVHTVDGAVTEGLFVSRADPEAATPAIFLSKTRNRKSDLCPALGEAELYEMLCIPLEEIVFVDAACIRVEAPAAGKVEPFRSTAFAEMNWAEIPPEDGANGNLEDEERAWVPGKWNQFAANEKFGVKSTYNEEQYTTILDKSKFTKEQMEHAERVAREIEKSSTRGVQHRIERGEEVEEDEGTIFSDVMRQQAAAPAPSEGKRAPAAGGNKAAYVPPSAKKASPTQPSAGTAAPAPVEPAASQPSSAVPPRKDSQAAPNPIEMTAPSPNASSGGRGGFNIGAKPFVPGGGGGGAAPALPPQTTAPIIEDMVAFLSRAIEGRGASANFANAEWSGEEYDVDGSLDLIFGSYHGNAVQQQHPGHAMHAHHHHHHHAQHQHAAHHHHHHHHHVHHSHQHHNQGIQQPLHMGQGVSGQGYGGQGAYGGQQPQGYSQSGPATRQPHSPTQGGQLPSSGPSAPAVSMNAPAVPRSNPPATLASSSKAVPAQPQQPVVVASTASSTSSGPAPVSVGAEEPRRNMSTTLGRGAARTANPTRHEDPAAGASAAAAAAAAAAGSQPPGSSLVPKKKSTTK